MSKKLLMSVMVDKAASAAAQKSLRRRLSRAAQIAADGERQRQYQGDENPCGGHRISEHGGQARRETGEPSPRGDPIEYTGVP
ncbi:hypothetical protein ACFXG4_14670 [Nocardia sp. NPDC059246]|uniref:hypothetical protein n=1 Tax=unclassified Nocardia TaxID=2637762 RepID=UPI00368DCBC6